MNTATRYVVSDHQLPEEAITEADLGSSSYETLDEARDEAIRRFEAHSEICAVHEVTFRRVLTPRAAFEEAS